MATDFIMFAEGEQYIDTHGDGLPAVVYFLLSTDEVANFTAATTLAGGVAEITGTGYARQSQTVQADLDNGDYVEIVFTGSAPTVTIVPNK